MTKELKYWKWLGIILPVAFGVILMVLLQTKAIHSLFGLKVLQLPLPSDIASAFRENFKNIVTDAGVTVLPALLGMTIGSLFGYLSAILATRFPNGGFGALILITALNSVPVVALAPIMNRWFGIAFFAKLVVVTVISIGAMSINAFRGMNDLPPHSLDLMKTYGSKPKTVFWKLRIPASVPYIFTALKVNVSAAMIGTIISEFFASDTAGLGYMIKYSLKVGNQKAVGWAYIVAAAMVSLIIYGIICVVEKQVLHWHTSQRQA